MKQIFGWRVFALFLAMVVLAAACGDDDGDEAASTAVTSTETTEAASTEDSSTETTEAATTEDTSTETSAAPAEVNAPDSITIAMPGTRGAATYASLEVSAEQGFPRLAELGVDVDVQGFGSGSDALAALLGGDAQVIFRGPSGMIAAAAQGEELTGILSHYQGLGVLLVGAEQYEADRGDDITTYDGAKWGIPALGGIGEAFPRALAEQSGMSWEDQQVVPLGGSSGLLAGLTSGQADLVVMSTDTAAAALDGGAGYLMVNGADVEVAANLFGPHLGQIVMVTSDFAEEYPEVTQALATDLIEGMKFVVDNIADPQAILDAYPDEISSEMDPDLFAVEWDLVTSSLLVSPVFDDDILESTLKLYVDSGTLEQSAVDGLDRERFFDKSYAENALEELGLSEDDFTG